MDHPSPDDIKVILRDIYSTLPASVSVKPIGKNIGYLSVIERIEMKWPTDCETLPKTMILKKPTDKTIAAMYGGAVGSNKLLEYWKTLLYVGHDRECIALKLLTQQGKYVIPAPRSYFGKPNSPGGDVLDGLILMEDLGGRAYTPSLAGGLSLPHLETIFLSFANLHAACILNPDTWVKPFQDLGTLPFYEDRDTIWKEVALMRKHYGEIFPFEDAVLAEFLTPGKIRHLWDFDAGRDFFRALVHGDMWGNNVMVPNTDEQTDGQTERQTDGRTDTEDGSKYANEGEIDSIIDWQLASMGPPVRDLVTLMATSVEPQLRRSKTKHLLEVYHAQLTKKVMEAESDLTEKLYDLGELEKLYKTFMSFGVYFLFWGLPTMIVDLDASEADKLRLAQRVTAWVQDTIAGNF